MIFNPGDKNADLDQHIPCILYTLSLYLLPYFDKL